MRVSFTAKHSDTSIKQDGKGVTIREKMVFPWVRFCFVLFLFFCPVFFFLYKMSLPWFIVESPGVISMAGEAVDRQRPTIVAFVDKNAFPFVRQGSLVRVILAGDRELSARVDALLPPEQAGGRMERAVFAGDGPILMGVRLMPLEALPAEYLTEGLPVMARWAVRLPDFLKKYIVKEDDE